MIQFMMLLGLMAPKSPVTAQVQPCVWPNRCAVVSTTLR